MYNSDIMVILYLYIYIWIWAITMIVTCFGSLTGPLPGVDGCPNAAMRLKDSAEHKMDANAGWLMIIGYYIINNNQ